MRGDVKVDGCEGGGRISRDGFERCLRLFHNTRSGTDSAAKFSGTNALASVACPPGTGRQP